jgi:L,D-peptidoglycan transpeptidase YkuD (ErfK/YbiS/YcfS/YnhG family)
MSAMTRRLLAWGTALLLAAAFLPAQPAGAAPTLTRNLAARLRTLPTATSQVVIVHAVNGATTYATLETFAKSDGFWRPVFAPMTARLGSWGFSPSHLEGQPSTPTGMYSFGSVMYGINANPGVHFAYHKLVSGDYWNELSGSAGYNTFQHGADPGGPSEALWTIKPAYNYFAVINYNVPAVAGKGSGIFLHQQTGGPTAGCVSLGAADLLKVLRWLTPAATPRIVMDTDAGLVRY